jgi:tetratricopeptide (TPR) repeat protein
MARRVNTRFLIAFSVIVLGGLLAAFILAGPGKYWLRGNPSKQLTAEGDVLAAAAEKASGAVERREKLDAAMRHYQQALAADPKNPDLYVRIGDLMTRLAPYDVNNFINQSRQAWEKALEINPDYLPALRRLQDSYYRETQIGNLQAGFFSRLRERAGQIHKLDPNDVRAHALMNIAVLNQWLSNIETTEADVDAAIAELTPLIEKNPTAPERADMVFFVAGARVKRGVDARRGGQSSAGNELLAQATKTFDDALKGQEQDANLHFRYFELLRFMRQFDYARDATEHYTDRMREQVEAARKLAKVEQDPDLFVKAYIAAHEVAMGQRDTKRAEELLVELHKARPDDQRVRLALAKYWGYDRAKQNDAIALLEQPIPETGWVGVEARLKANLEVQTLANLANMYIDRYAGLSKDADRAEELKRIDATYDRLYARARERSEVLKVRGKIELLRGGTEAPVRAIQTFEKAQAQSVIETGGREDVELTFLLARAYYASRQSGQAKAQLQKFVRVAPEQTAARLMLAQLLVSEGDANAAKEHIDFLEKRTPEDPEFIRLKLATLKPGDAIAARALFDRLPEDAKKELDAAARRRQRLAKAQLAPLAPISAPDEAMRLYKLVLAENPADFEALQGARNVLVAQGKKDDAVALLTNAKSKVGGVDAERIDLILKQLQGASPADLKAAAEELLSKQEDPFTREVKLYELHMAGGNREEAFKHLRAAEQVRPDDVRIQEQLFQFHLGARDWDKATWYADRLAEKNVDQAGGLIFRFRLAMARGQIDVALDHAREMTTRLKEFAPSWVLYGQAQQAAGKFDEAIASYTAALDKQSENADALEGIINCYYQLNKPTEALQYIQRGLRSNPNSPKMKSLWRAHQLSPWGDPTLVIKPATAERDLTPDDPAKWQDLGQAQLAAAARKNDKDAARYAADAKATFTEALKRWPDEKAFWAPLVELAAMTNDRAGGEALLKDMIARPKFKDDPQPSLMLADLYLRTNDPAAAEAAVRQAIARFPKNADLLRRLAAYYTQTGRLDDAIKLLDPASPDKLVRQQLAEVYVLAKKYAEAEKVVAGLIESEAKDAPAAERAQLQAMMGIILLNRQQPERALKSLDAALALDPKNQAALYTRGTLRMSGANPQLDEAVKDLTALRDAEPRHVDARVALAEAYRQKQQYAAAAREMEEVLRLAPGRRDVRVGLVNLYTTSFRPPAWGEAERLVNQAKQAEPRDITWPRLLGGLYSRRGAFDRAVTEIEAAFALDQKNAQEIKDYRLTGDLLRDYLDVLEKAGKYPQLAALADQLLQDKATAASGWWVYVRRAAARARTGRKDDALADFQRAMEIGFADKDMGADIHAAVVDKLA